MIYTVFRIIFVFVGLLGWYGNLFVHLQKQNPCQKKKEKPLIFKLINVSRDECVEQKSNARG
jgi:hypothetical protein